MFDSDGYDSDGDGVSNLLERAFGGDSLSNDAKSILPKRISKGITEYISFTKSVTSTQVTIRYFTLWKEVPITVHGESLVNQTAVSESDLGGGMQRLFIKV